MNKYDLFIIDSDSSALKNICDGLKGYPITFKLFEDSNQAFDELHKAKPKVVIVDKNMPLLNAKEFIIKMSQHCLFQNSTVILTTDKALDDESTQQFKTLGFSEVFVKPLHTKNIIQVLEDIGIIREKKAA